jgi:glycosyltransferase involved in cell wall biosynthesis
VATVARLIPVKRLERFLHALALARRQVPEMQGVLVGSGPENGRLHALAESLGLQPDQPFGGVQFLGEQPEIPQILAQSDLFVLTSDREGFPNVILEAMAASLPVIATPAGECRALVQEGLNGYQVTFDDHQALAERLVTLARSPALRRKLGHAARRMVETQFGYDQLGTSLTEVYRAIAHQVKSQAVLSALSNGKGTMPGRNSPYHQPGITPRESR